MLKDVQEKLHDTQLHLQTLLQLISIEDLKSTGQRSIDAYAVLGALLDLLSCDRYLSKMLMDGPKSQTSTSSTSKKSTTPRR